MKDIVALIGTCQKLRAIVKRNGFEKLAVLAEIPQLQEVEGLKKLDQLIDDPSSLTFEILQDAADGLHVEGQSKESRLTLVSFNG